ncbi:MAG: ROK family transcriptional regulator [Candidatus Marinimicrobia bacterium]|nr:ROK family transcriptional regulator [Candidatus Neomarinimicrobiota bacterium]
MNVVNSQLIKELNEIRILTLVKSEEIISRVELAKRTKISKVAVSDIVNRLIEAGYIAEIGKGESTKKGGKRPTLLKLLPNNGFVVGLEIHSSFTKIAIANLNSEIVCEEIVSYQTGDTIVHVLPKIIDMLDTMLKRKPMYQEKLISIGIGVPGFIDYEKGELAFAVTIHGWVQHPLASVFSEKYKVPVIIENDVNARTYGEYLLGAGQDTDNMVCIWLGEGLGAGIIVDGNLIRGRYGSAGELGYLELGHHLANPSLVKNLYTNQHRFGSILREQHLLDTIKLKIQYDMHLGHIDVDKLTLEELLSDEHHEYSSIVREILDEYAMLLAILCTDLIKTLNTSKIILSGMVIEYSEYLLDKCRQIVRQNMHNIPFQATPIEVGTLKDEGCIKGVIVMALQVIFEPLLKTTSIKKASITS